VKSGERMVERGGRFHKNGVKMLEKCDFGLIDIVFLSHTIIMFLFIIFLTKWGGE